MKNRNEFRMKLRKLTALFIAVSLFTSLINNTVYGYSLNDRYLNAQWALDNKGQYTYYIGMTSYQEDSKEDVDINLFEGWDIYPEEALSNEIIVAVIDTGVYTDHPDLTDHIWVNTAEIPGNGIDDDGNGYIDDVYGWDFFNGDNTVWHDEVYTDSTGSFREDDHGTHVAGIIAASADNGYGIVGVASLVNVKVMVLKVNGGKNSEGTAENAAKAIRYAEMMGARVANLSWGSYSYDETLKKAMEESKMLFVCAAGNDESDNDLKPLYPASYALDNIIAVTYIDAKGGLVSSTSGYFATKKGSNFGVETVDIAAPGTDILSTVSGGGYAYKSGSSMAAPFVTGAVALALAYNPLIYSVQAKQMLLSSAKKFDNLNGLISVPGIPDICEMTKLLHDVPRDETAPEIKIIQNPVGEQISLKVKTDDASGSGVYLIRYAEGIRDCEYFMNGGGTRIHEDDVVTVNHGEYSFFAEDRCSNATVSIVSAGTDNDAPKLKASVKPVENTDLYEVLLLASDKSGNISKIRYLYGRWDEETVRKEGIGLTGKDELVFTAEKSNEAISFYAEDSFGNSDFLVVELKVIEAAGMLLSMTECILKPEKQYKLAALVLPTAAYGELTYESTDPLVAEVSPDGMITAVGIGQCEIIVRLQDGTAGTALVRVE